MEHTSKRRKVLIALGAGLFVPSSLVLAQAARMLTVVILFAGDSEDDEASARPFFAEMERLGWTEGKNVTYDRLSGKGTLQYLESLASTAAGREADLIFATTTSLALAIAKAAENTPVVFATASDPIAAGLVNSLERPGRNSTGVYQVAGDAVQKRYKKFKAALPALKKMGVMFDRNAPDYQSRQGAHQAAARAAGIELEATEFSNFEAVAKLLAQYRRRNIFIVGTSASFSMLGRRKEVCTLAARNGIAMLAHRVEWVEAGAVVSYGADVGEGLRRVARLSDRILKGGKAAEIPVDRFSKFELAINSRAAKELGLHIPQAVVKRADRVIT